MSVFNSTWLTFTSLRSCVLSAITMTYNRSCATEWREATLPLGRAENVEVRSVDSLVVQS